MASEYSSLGPPNAAASSAGGEGTVNAKLRLQTTQLDNIATKLDTLNGGGVPFRNDRLRAGSGTVTVNYASIDVSNAGNTIVVSGTTNYKIRVIGLTLSGSGAATDPLYIGINSTTNVKVAPLRAFPGTILDFYRQVGWVAETNAGEHLVLNLSIGVPVRGFVNYVLVEQ